MPRSGLILVPRKGPAPSPGGECAPLWTSTPSKSRSEVSFNLVTVQPEIWLYRGYNDYEVFSEMKKDSHVHGVQTKLSQFYKMLR